LMQAGGAKSQQWQWQWQWQWQSQGSRRAVAVSPSHLLLLWLWWCLTYGHLPYLKVPSFLPSNLEVHLHLQLID